MTRINNKDLLIILFIISVWGCNYAVSKIGVLEVPPMFLLSIRFLAVGVMLTPFLKFPRHHFWPLLQFSFTFGFLHFALVYVGLQKVDAGVTSILVQLQAPFGGLLSYLMLKEKLTKEWAIGLGIAFFGTFLILGEPKTASEPFSVLLIVLSAIMWGVSYVQLKLMNQRKEKISGMEITGWMGLFAAPFLFASSFLLETNQWSSLMNMSLAAQFSLIYQIFLVGIFAYAFWYKLIAKYPVGSVAPFTLLIPVFSIVAGYFLLNESIATQSIVGSVLVLVGIAINNKFIHLKKWSRQPSSIKNV